MQDFAVEGRHFRDLSVFGLRSPFASDYNLSLPLFSRPPESDLLFGHWARAIPLSRITEKIRIQMEVSLSLLQWYTLPVVAQTKAACRQKTQMHSTGFGRIYGVPQCLLFSLPSTIASLTFHFPHLVFWNVEPPLTKKMMHPPQFGDTSCLYIFLLLDATRWPAGVQLKS